MYRYGGYGYRRRRSHRLRNLLVILLLLVAAGAALTLTGYPRDALNRFGLLTRSSHTSAPTAVAQAGPSEAAPIAVSTPAPTTRTTRPASPISGVVPTTARMSAPTTATQVVNATATKPPTPTPTPTQLPVGSPLNTAQKYLTAWQQGDYKGMYALLSASAKKQYSQDYFVKRYPAINAMVTVQKVQASLLPAAQKAANGAKKQVQLPFTVTMSTRLVGDITETNQMSLVQEGADWRVQWSPSLIFKELSGANLIRMYPYASARGSIFDRGGEPLAIDGRVAQIGVIPGQIKNEQAMLSRLSQALGLSASYIKSKYQGQPADWFIPIRDLMDQQASQLQQQFASVPGVAFGVRAGRTYPQGTVLAQVLGWVGSITADDLKNPEFKDYGPNAVIGRTGLEHWGEQYLHGQDGGKLAVVTPDGQIANVIKNVPARNGDNIYLNIDLNFQKIAEDRLGNLSGSIVGIDPRNGQILGLVSHPSFDPNLFVVGISNAAYAKLTAPSAHNPFQNRATASSYPMASTFKPITMAAALTYPLPGITKKVWYDDGTWQRDSLPPRHDWKPGGHGYINLEEALVESADDIFYDLGYDLYEKGFDYLSKYAKKWWLGQSPNVDGVLNATGQVPGPGVPLPGWSAGDNVNLSIGQGALNVSPLQAANVYATIANGGTIYRPQLINRIVSPDGKVVKQYKPEVLGKAPVSPQNLRMIQQGLAAVAQSYPKGTASGVFHNFPIPVSGKTGTGQQDRLEPFAWFDAYAPSTNPRITVAMVAENAGEGSVVAAPVVKDVLLRYLHPPAQQP